MIFSILIVTGLTWALALTLLYYIGKGVLEQKIGNNFRSAADETGKSLSRLISHGINEAYALSLSADISDLLLRVNKAYDGRPPMTENEIARMETGWKEDPSDSRSRERILTNPAAKRLKEFFGRPGEEDESLITLITDRRGVIVASDREPEKIYLGDQAWWRSTLRAAPGQAYVSDIEGETPLKRTLLTYIISIAVPIYAAPDPAPVGVLLIAHPVKQFFDLVTQVKLAKTDHTMLAGSDGNLLFCPIFLVKNHTLKPELIREITQEKPGWGLTTVDVHYPGPRSINGFAPVSLQNLVPGSLGGHRWYIFTSQNPKETYEPIDTLLIGVAGLGLFGMGMLAFFSLYATGQLVKPIKELQKGAKRIASGALEHRLVIETGDEIEDLAVEFNQMADKIQASHAQLEQKVAQRTHDLALRNKELSALYIIASILNKTLNLKESLDEALQATMKIFQTEAGMIHLLGNEGEGPLRWVSAKGLSTELFADSKEPLPEEIIYRQVIERGVPLSFSDESLEKAPFRNIFFPYFISIPIRSKGKTMGTLSLFDKSSRPFINQDLELLGAIGNQIGVAIENARLYEETKKIDQLKSDFVSKVSHEFRTPLTSIKGFVEILLSSEEIPEEKRREFLGIVNQESDRLIRLINDVLDISKIEAGKIQWRIEPLNLEEIIRTTIQSTQTLVERKRLQLAVAVAPRLPEVIGDRDQLIQVLNNLLSNAVKFTEKGTITLSARPSEDQNEVVVEVKDTGIGVPPSELTKIFNKFYQVARPEKGLPKGTGLGLAICREIILHLGGRIWCESAPGEGSAFLFTLPAASQKVERPAPTSPLLEK